MGERPPDEGDGRHIAGSTTGALVAYVRRQYGDEAITKVFEMAGERRSPDDVSATTTWSSYDQAVALFTAAVDFTGDPSVGRAAGEEMLAQYAGTEVAALLRSLGSPAEVLRNVAATAAKFSTVTVMDAVELSDGWVLIEAKTGGGVSRHRCFCLFTEGLLSQATPLFGLPAATVVELECQTRGDGRCLYGVSWDPGASADDDLARKCEHLETELKALAARFEALQATATELVTAATVDDLLASVTRRAGLAVRAPRHLLAVRLTPASSLRVHHSGFASDEEARDAADRLLAAEPDESESRLVVDVATVRNSFGRIAALYPDGARFFPQERRLLEAYAGHVAAALEAAASLEGARRESATARALLDLGRALGDIASPEEVAERLVVAMGPVVACDQATVFLWNPDTESLELTASVGLPEKAAASFEGLKISSADTPLVAALLADPTPQLLNASSMTDPLVGRILAEAGVDVAAIVPIVSGGQLFGLATAAFYDHGRLVDPDADLLERLTGMADHAATALQNSYLLRKVKAQALRDPLTGLPNARLIEDRATIAISTAKRDSTGVAVLFIDLDRFKPVNDTFGHAAGDQVLIETASRMKSVLRAGDTLGRLAGDEFVIVLPSRNGEADAMAVAEKLSDVLQEPFAIGTATAQISASIGIAMFPQSGTSYDELLKQADSAMYRAKAQRRPSHAFA